MSSPSTAREALIVEALGEVLGVIQRLEAVAPALDASRLALVRDSAKLVAQVDSFENRMVVITENAKVRAVQHIARRTDEMARSTLDAQTRAMEEAARTLFRNELAPAFQRLVVPLQQLAERAARPFESWLTHAATAVMASALTWAVAAWLWAR
jgi:hypothetical protein